VFVRIVNRFVIAALATLVGCGEVSLEVVRTTVLDLDLGREANDGDLATLDWGVVALVNTTAFAFDDEDKPLWQREADAILGARGDVVYLTQSGGITQVIGRDGFLQREYVDDVAGNVTLGTVADSDRVVAVDSRPEGCVVTSLRDGGLEWETTLAERGCGTENSVTADADGNVYVKVSPRSDDEAPTGLFFARLSPTGALEWARPLVVDGKALTAAKFLRPNHWPNLALRHIGSYASDNEYTDLGSAVFDSDGEFDWYPRARSGQQSVLDSRGNTLSASGSGWEISVARVEPDGARDSETLGPDTNIGAVLGVDVADNGDMLVLDSGGGFGKARFSRLRWSTSR